MTYRLNPGSESESDLLDLRLTRALEASPRFTIPAGFASRTAALAQDAASTASSYPVFTSISRFSRLSIRIAFAVLVIAMLVLPILAGNSTSFSANSEVVLALELVGLTTWLSLRRNELF